MHVPMAHSLGGPDFTIQPVTMGDVVVVLEGLAVEGAPFQHRMCNMLEEDENIIAKWRAQRAGRMSIIDVQMAACAFSVQMVLTAHIDALLTPFGQRECETRHPSTSQLAPLGRTRSTGTPIRSHKSEWESRIASGQSFLFPRHLFPAQMSNNIWCAFN